MIGQLPEQTRPKVRNIVSHSARGTRHIGFGASLGNGSYQPPLGRVILVALGANLSGPWGSPTQSIRRAVEALERLGCEIVGQSPLYLSEPMGLKHQPPFVNGVVALRSPLAPHVLLRAMKHIERCAGRGRIRRQRPRTLDLDLLDYKGFTVRRDSVKRQRARPSLVLPHPEIAIRPFVVRPLMDIRPLWHHPGSGEPIGAVWRKLRLGAHGRIVRRIG